MLQNCLDWITGFSHTLVYFTSHSVLKPVLSLIFHSDPAGQHLCSCTQIIKEPLSFTTKRMPHYLLTNSSHKSRATIQKQMCRKTAWQLRPSDYLAHSKQPNNSKKSNKERLLKWIEHSICWIFVFREGSTKCTKLNNKIFFKNGPH